MNILIYENNYFFAGIFLPAHFGETLMEKANILKALFVPTKEEMQRIANLKKKCKQLKRNSLRLP